jgi:peptidyl-prolyl cis-trans isomerase A (cyclophilin A)
VPLPNPTNLGEFSVVRFLTLLIALAGPLHADLLAHVQTTQGNVDVVMQYATAPQAVANFITLAQGTRPWVDPINGRIRTDPFYNGIKIHRTSNNSGYKFAQGGSPKGDGSDGPGYTFKDEFNSPLTHLPYVLSMANAGPNTNGSQFFFTGSLSQPSFNNVHTIFGLVTDPISRSVVDAMIEAGPNGTTINAVTFTRTDAAAIAFNEHAQNLPEVSCPSGSLTVNRGVSAVWNLNSLMSTGAIFHAYRSSTLANGSWSELGSATLHVGISSSPLVSPAVASATLDNAEAPSAFYNLYVARHPGSVAPSNLLNRTILIAINGGVIYYAHNAAGNGGNATYQPDSGAQLNFTFNTYSFRSAAHEISCIIQNIGIDPANLLLKIGCDSATTTQIDGRHSTQYFDQFTGWEPWSKGAAAISR